MRKQSLPILLVAALAVGAGPEQGDLGKIQGRWVASVGKRREFSVTLEVKGNDVSATIAPKRGPKVKAMGVLKLDESASPRSLDWVKFSTADGIEVPRLLSIYRLEGDRLILRSGGFNDARPKVFEPGGEGAWTEVLVFTRPATTPKVGTVTSNPEPGVGHPVASPIPPRRRLGVDPSGRPSGDPQGPASPTRSGFSSAMSRSIAD